MKVPEEAKTKKKKESKGTAKEMGDGLTRQGMPEPPNTSLALEKQAPTKKNKKRKRNTEGIAEGATTTCIY